MHRRGQHRELLPVCEGLVVLKAPEKNSIKWIDLFGKPLPPLKEGEKRNGEVEPITTRPDFEGVKVGVRHVGPKKLRPWRMALLNVRKHEARRVADLRKETTAETAPDFWSADYTTPELQEETQKVVDTVLSESVAGLDGDTDLAKDDAPGALELLGYLDVDEGFQLMERILEMQSLSKRQFFRSAGPGDLAPE